MAIQTFTVLALKNYSGTTPSPAAGVDWPAGVRSATLRVASTDFIRPTDTIYLELQESIDGGANWKFMCSCGPVQGGLLDRSGQPLLPNMTITLGPEELATPRKVRGLMTIVGSVRLSLLIDILS
jgi:hypothetical protein